MFSEFETACGDDLPGSEDRDGQCPPWVMDCSNAVNKALETPRAAHETLFAYGISIFTVCVVLLTLDHLPMLTEPMVALKRIVVLAFPASMGAMVVDRFDKE